MANSAFTTAEKLNILTNEGNRRLRNHSPHLSWNEKKKDLDTLMIQMEECGHSEAFRAVVAVRVISRYQKSLRSHNQGERRMYRSREEQQTQVKEAGGRQISPIGLSVGELPISCESQRQKTASWQSQ